MNGNVESRTETRGTEQTRSGLRFTPSVDIIENENALLVLADMPGADPRSVDVDFENGKLTIRGSVAQRQGEDARYFVREYGIGDFHRTFAVSEQIDASRITAEYNSGVLKLTLPKAEAAKPRKIAVKTR